MMFMTVNLKQQSTTCIGSQLDVNFLNHKPVNVLSEQMNIISEMFQHFLEGLQILQIHLLFVTTIFCFKNYDLLFICLFLYDLGCYPLYSFNTRGLKLNKGWGEHWT